MEYNAHSASRNRGNPVIVNRPTRSDDGRAERKGKKMKSIEQMRKDGYPLKIIDCAGYEATLVGCQPLFDGDYMAIYRFPGGNRCVDLYEIKYYFTIKKR